MRRLRSGRWGYTGARHIGYVSLPLALALAGVGTLEVEVFGLRRAATVAPDVLYDPEGGGKREHT